jgi:riboflavin kinase
MKTGMLDVLVELARSKARVTTTALAVKLGSSQQTISRKIRELENLGLIERTLSRGQFIALTDEGMKFLRKRYLELKNVVEYSKEQSLSFGGHVIEGSGEGQYYVGQEEYFLQFNEKLGFRPFLGTLNIRLKNVHDIKTKGDIERTKPIIVNGFKRENRTFGDIRCYPCIVNRRIKGAIVIPVRSHHPSDVVEIIAPVNLRKALSAVENDYVHVEVRA